jgi:predicted RNase H-like HicB family nuclease
LKLVKKTEKQGILKQAETGDQALNAMKEVLFLV